MKRFMIMVVLVVALLAGNVYAGESKAMDYLRSMPTSELRVELSIFMAMLAESKADLADDKAMKNTFIFSIHELGYHGKPLPEGVTLAKLVDLIRYLDTHMESHKGDIMALEDLIDDVRTVLNERRAM